MREHGGVDQGLAVRGLPVQRTLLHQVEEEDLVGVVQVRVERLVGAIARQRSGV